MDYNKHYYNLIERAKSRVLEGYVEKHHIIPKCFGGTDDVSNLVILTPEEHYIAHQLLVKLYPNEEKLAYAARMMCIKSSKHHRNNKLYGWLKTRYHLSLKTIKRKKRKKEEKPRKPRAKETKPRKKRTLSNEHKQKIGQSRIGYRHSPESIEKIRQKNILTKNKSIM